MKLEYDVYVITVTPHDGWGKSYIWGIYQEYDNAKEGFNDFCKKYHFEQLSDNYGYYTESEINYNNRFREIKIECFYFSD